jgi:hypothetical protein
MDHPPVRLAQRANGVQSYIATTPLTSPLTPSPATGVVTIPPGTGVAYRDANGRDFVGATVSWTEPVTNTDGSALLDLDFYNVQFRVGLTGTWSPSQTTAWGIPTIYYPSLQPGTNVYFRVQAVNTSGNKSVWANSAAVSMPAYLVPLLAPASPAMTPMPGGVVVSWGGKNSSSATYDSSWVRCDVYLNPTSSFTPPGQGILYGAITALNGGSKTITGLPYGNAYVAKLVAIDRSGNTSAASGPSPSVTVPQVVGSTDIAQGSVTTPILGTGAASADKLTTAGRMTGLALNSSFEESVPGIAAQPQGWTLSSTGAGSSATRLVNQTIATQGTAMAALTCGGSGAGFSAQVVHTSNIPVTANGNYYVRAAYGGSVATTNGVYFQVNWFKADGVTPSATPVSYITNNGALQATPVNNLVADGQVNPPSDAVYATLGAQFSAPSAAGSLYVDSYNIQPGISGSSIIPGTLPPPDLTGANISGGSFGSGTIDTSTIDDSILVCDDGNGAVLVYVRANQTVNTYDSTTSWTCPASGVSSVKVECWGGGGGGYCGAYGGAGKQGGTGGGGGEYARENVIPVTANQTYNIIIGGGGPGGTAALGPGQNGGSTSFTGDGNAQCLAHGGQGGPSTSTPALGGGGSTNVLHYNGGNGGKNSSSLYGSGGGGAAGASMNGNVGKNATASAAGAGGLGAGGGAAGGTGGTNASTSAGNGLPGQAGYPGGGGGGGGASSSSGGAGTGGRIKLSYGGTYTLVASVAGVSFNDPFGNAVQPGITVYRTDLFPLPGATGEVRMWAGSTAPYGWWTCDGRALSRANNPGLFAVIGTTYGAGDGSTTFNIPDFRNSFPMGNTISQQTANTMAAQLRLSATDSAVLANVVTVPGYATNWANTITGMSVGGSIRTNGVNVIGNPTNTGVLFIIKN